MGGSAFLLLLKIRIWLGYLWPILPLGLVAASRRARPARSLAYWIVGFVVCHGVRDLTNRVIGLWEYSVDSAATSAAIAMRYLEIGYAGIVADVLLCLPLMIWWHRILGRTNVAKVPREVAL